MISHAALAACFGPLHYERWHSLVILVNPRGETLFDDRRDMRTWATESEAAAWLAENEPGVEVEACGGAESQTATKERGCNVDS